MRLEHPPRWRRLLKDAIASAIWRAHAHPLSAVLTARGPRPLVIGYHRVVDDLAAASSPRAQLAWEAFVEGVIKAVAALLVSVPGLRDVMLSGRAGTHPRVAKELMRGLARLAPAVSVRLLDGFASQASRAAQGAALIADGLAGGRSAALGETLGIREAAGTVVDHLYVITPAAALARLGLSA